jgi:hypothetical protein
MLEVYREQTKIQGRLLMATTDMGPRKKLSELEIWLGKELTVISAMERRVNPRARYLSGEHI